MKSLFVFLFLGALICSVEGFGRAKEGKCPTPKAKCKPFLKKRICFQDIECSGKRKCCPDGCGNDVCMTAVMPPRPIVGSCPEDARVAITIKNNRRCRRKKTKFCFKGDCNRCCYYKSRCNPHPKLLNNLGACEKELCAKKKCPFQGEVCYFNKKKQAVSCKCNRSCRTPTKNDTVCGTDRITYPSPCEMNLTACQLGDFIGIDYRGECRDNKVTISQAHVDSVSLISGTNGSVVCHFKGHPVQIQWSKQGLDRLPENRMLPYDNMLYIRLVRKEDAGKYFCRAFDGVSTITATVNVTIKEPELVTSKAIQPRRVCMLGKSQGPGQNYIVRFYFNFKTRLCTAFAYGGTGGNENNFKTLERCKRACSHSATPTEICRLAKRPGRCKQRLPKWYYDQRKGKCKMFHYGGCDGNANRFDTENECLQTCSNLACKLPKAVGKCKAHIARWFFNIKTGKCEKFMYTGCDGNSNQYPSKKHCEMKCNPSSSRRRIMQLREKSGICPVFNVAICEDFVWDQCMVDSDCTGREKCCNNGCIKKCLRPVTKPKKVIPKVKLGRCPAPTFSGKVCSNRYQNDVCAVDQDCPGIRKCCHNGCNFDCVYPPEIPNGKSKPGKCPVVDPDEFQLCSETNDECSSDGDCFGPMKCCFTGCVRACVPVPKPEPKPGQCPIQDYIDPEMCVDTNDECLFDEECSGSSKCCFSGCKMECLSPPGVARPGSCPSPWKGSNGYCDKRGDSCFMDSDCRVDSHKCCFNGCQKDCVAPGFKPPIKQEPDGRCPKPWKDKRFCDRMGDKCRDESDCYGNYRCCFNGCQKDCVKPVNLTKCQVERQKARDQLADELPPVGVYVPTCEKNGYYTKKQCHDALGECWCVDMIGHEISETRRSGPLNCSSIEEIVGHCPKPWKNMKKCDRMGDQCRDESDCYGNLRCCFSGCQKECIKPVNLTKCQVERQKARDQLADELPPVGVYVPTCEKNGYYTKKQCHDAVGECWCVTVMDGTELNGTRTSQPLLDCQEIDPCDNVTCPFYGMCKDDMNGNTTCECPTVCTLDYTPVCGSDGVTYGNLCSMKAQACASRKMITVDHDGECSKGPVLKCLSYQCGDSKLSVFSECKPKGITCPPSANRCARISVTVQAVPGIAMSIFRQEVGMCTVEQGCDPIVACSSINSSSIDLKSCKVHCCKGDNCNRPTITSDPCDNVTCPFYGMCKADMNGNTTCECPAACTADYTPVCGSDGVTYGNLCGMKAAACASEQMITVKHNGECKKVGNKTDQCPRQWKGKLGICDLRGDMCTTKKDCQFGQICCDNGCQNDCVFPDGKSPCQRHRKDATSRRMPGLFVPTCHEDGHYARVQCHGSSGFCWCADMYGNERPFTRVRGDKPNCNLNVVPGFVDVVNGSCPQPTKGRDGICDRMGDQCTIDSTCSGDNEKCCFNGCQRECIDVIAPPPDHCNNVTCPFYGMCKADMNGNTTCECPTVCTMDYTPVCGSDGVTYGNLCGMKAAACASEQMITVKHNGECKKGPGLKCLSYQCGDSKLSVFSECKPNVTTCPPSANRCARISVTVQAVPGVAMSIFRQEVGMCTVEQGCDPIVACSSINSSSIDLKSCKVHCCKGDKCNRPTITSVRNKTDQCPRQWKGKLGICDLRGDMCTTKKDCQFGQICCDNGCQNDCVFPDGKSPCQRHRKDATSRRMPGLFVPTCHEDGHYARVQCHGSSGFCWCADMYGNERPFTRVRGDRPNCNLNVVPGFVDVVNGSCPLPTKGRDGICDRMGDQCTIDSTCSGDNEKCCFNGCQRECIDVIAPPLDPCDNVTCPFYGMCKDDMNGNTTCECPTVCTLDYTPVCGSDGVTYGNLCSMKAKACASRKMITVDHDGECSKGPGLKCLSYQCGDSKLSVFSECKPNVTTCPPSANRCARISVTVQAVPGVAMSIFRQEVGMCTVEQGCDPIVACSSINSSSIDLKSCKVHCCKGDNCNRPTITSDPCDNVTCPFYGMCKTDMNGNTTCECPTMCTMDYTPVCGSDGVTYGNLCGMKAAACAGEQMITVKHNGECKKVKKCPKPWKGKDGICDRRGDMCRSNASCNFGQICCFNGCQKDCLYPDGKSPCQRMLQDAKEKTKQFIVGHFTPSCHQNGHYNPMQCHGSTGHCWCVDIDGNERPYTRIRGKPNCNLNVVPGFVDVVNGSCPLPTKGRDGICDRMGDQCTIDSTCSGDNEKCCFNGCQRECIDVIAPPPDLCDNVTCPFYGMCKDDMNGNTTCECPAVCTLDYTPVCGSDGITYGNLCSMKAKACASRKMITVDHDGECSKGPGLKCLSYQCGDSKLSVFSECKPNVTTCPPSTNRCARISVTVQAVPGVAMSIFRQEIGMCTVEQGCDPIVACSSINSSSIDLKSCKVHCCKGDKCNRPTITSDPCDNVTCPFYGMCKADMNGNTTCECPTVCTLDYTPVCGSDGVTYGNLCGMKAAACASEQMITVKHNGECKKVSKCPKPWKGKDGICDRRGDMCRSNASCNFGQICCFNGCQKDCLYPDGKSPCQRMLQDAKEKTKQFIVGHFTPSCHQNGHYNPIQCHGSTGHCWCVDIDGNERPYTRIRGKPNCNLNVVPGFVDVVNGSCPLPTKGRDGICDRMGDQCTIDSTCSGDNEKCCFNGCQRECIDVIAPPPDPCDNVTCPFYGMCKDDMNGNTTCECPTVCTLDYTPVCGSDGVTYGNLCSMKAKACASRKMITVDHDGECSKGPGLKCLSYQCGDSKLSVFSECKPNVTTCPPSANRCARISVTVQAVPGVAMSIFRQEIGMCTVEQGCDPIVACSSINSSSIDLQSCKVHCCKGDNCNRPTITSDPCDNVTCPFYGMCKTDMNGNTTCECPTVCTMDYTPVCGSDGVTYGNLCGMKAAACASEQMITVKHNGECKKVNKCPKPWKGKDGICDRRGDMCRSNASCNFGQICCFNGCQKDCLYPDGKSPCQRMLQEAKEKTKQFIVGHFTPSCHQNGHYNPMQCHGSTGHCWCVDIDGNERPYTRIRGKPNCNLNVVPGFVDVVNGSCPLPTKGRDGICDRMGDQCTIDSTCSGDNEKCCFNGCQRECIDVIAPPPPDPCDNVTCPFYGMCKDDMNGNTTCECPTVCTMDYTPVCGSDGVTYGNLCSMKTAACASEQMITVKHNGDCKKDPCDNVTCPFYGMCKDDMNGNTTCECPTVCTLDYTPVCGSDGVTYGNLCSMKAKACSSEQMITVKHNGECKKEKPKGKCPKTWKGKRGFCDFRGDMCDKNNDDCPFGQICCSNGCQNDCVYPDGKSPCIKHRKSIIPKSKILFTPSCHENGFYDEVQCHGSPRYCWCSDQYGNELPFTRIKGRKPNCNLPAVHGFLPGINGTCPQPNKGRNGVCDKMGDTCTLDKDCSDGKKCCFNGCQRTCVDAIPSLPPPDPKLTPCQKKRQEILGDNELPPPGMYLPSCDENGDFTAVQCHGSVGECWCVNVNNGNIITSTRISTRQGAVRNCSDEALTKCQRHYRDALDNPPIGRFLPACEDSGKYEPMQCHGSVGQCWCVDDKGDELEGTRGRQRPDCTPPSPNPCDDADCGFYGICKAGKDGSTSCECPLICPEIYAPVCGSDNKTYSNECEMKTAACTKKIMVTIISQGECHQPPSPCDKIKCSHKMQQCNVLNDKPVCQCPMIKCSSKDDPVCGSDGKTYRNSCYLDSFSCPNSQDIRIEYQGKCEVKESCDDIKCSHPQQACLLQGVKAVCECPQYDCLNEKKEVCGTDMVTYNNPCEMEAYACQYNMNISAAYDGPCQGKDADPCTVQLCSHPQQTCRNVNGSAICQCRKMATKIYAPVCGSDGKTYSNKMIMENAGCEKNMVLTVVKRGKCDEPDPCANVMCSHPQQNCRVVNGSAVCECRKMKTLEYNPVCASEGKNYPNKMSMENAGCEKNMVLTIEKRGSCADAIDICELKPVTGPCFALIPRYFFNKTSGKCEQFSYGGCRGNENRFTTEEDCKKTCGDKQPRNEPSDPCEISLCSYPDTECVAINGSATCKCPQACNKIYQPVCGTDGKTYPNSCNLNVEACKPQNRATLRKKHDGPCKDKQPRNEPSDPCEISLCSYPDTECVAINGSATCKCPQACTKIYQPVCGTDGKTYPSSCNLNVEACKPQNRATLRKKHDGPCKAIDICELKPVTGPCFALIPSYFFNKTSGKCEQFSYGGCRGNENRFTTENDCNKTCGGFKPCDFMTCSRPYAMCKASKCSCPVACSRIYRPVTGSDGKKYNNLCLMRVASCNSGNLITVKPSLPLLPDMCPQALSIECPLVRPKNECEGNSDCPPNKRCCNTGCHKQCIKALPSKPKPGPPAPPGKCPPTDPKPCPPGPIAGSCQTDAQCSGSNICCHDGCTKRCTMPVIPRPTRCPKINPMKCNRKYDKSEYCKSNGDCPRSQICCFDGCIKRCGLFGGGPPVGPPGSHHGGFPGSRSGSHPGNQPRRRGGKRRGNQ